MEFSEVFMFRKTESCETENYLPFGWWRYQSSFDIAVILCCFGAVPIIWRIETIQAESVPHIF